MLEDMSNFSNNYIILGNNEVFLPYKSNYNKVHYEIFFVSISDFLYLYINILNVQ